MKYVGIDVGGMTIKGGIVDEKGNILLKKSIVTSPGKEDRLIVDDIATLVNDLIALGAEQEEIAGVGIGCPGSIYDEKGIVRYSCNINFRNTPMARMIAEKTGISNVKLSNDANCAALGETLSARATAQKLRYGDARHGSRHGHSGKRSTHHGQSLGRRRRRTYFNQYGRRDLRMRKERLLRGIRVCDSAYESDSVRLRKTSRKRTRKSRGRIRHQRKSGV